MASKSRQKYRSSRAAYLGGIIRLLSQPEPIRFGDRETLEQQREVEWLDCQEENGPGWDKSQRGETCAWEIPLTAEEKVVQLKRKPVLKRAICFAGEKHATQLRKDKQQTPYIEHLFAVCSELLLVGKVTDPEVLAAGFLHDTLEDTETTREELESIFGRRVRMLVEEVSDDKSLPKEERKRLQIEHAARLSKDAALIKLADKISNVSDVIFNPPRDWDIKRREDYLTWAEAVVSASQRVNLMLEARFAQIVSEGRALLRDPHALRAAVRAKKKDAFDVGREVVLFALNSSSEKSHETSNPE